MNATDTKTLVRDWYGSVATGRAGCCGPATPQEASCSMGYSEAELASLPEGADLGLGCGNPQAFAAMRPGEVVVDLGSGADRLLPCRPASGTRRPDHRHRHDA